MKSTYQGLEDLTIPNDWQDITYSNDACPSYLTGKFKIFCDHRLKEQRECPSWERFQAIQVNDDLERIDNGISFEAETMEELFSLLNNLSCANS